MKSRLEKIVSGGQTGVDRAALDVAIFLDIPHGGWCPSGRRSEDGTIPEIYQLKETDSRDYSVRTEKNVLESDATLILFEGKMSGGTELTRRLARKHKRPHLCVDLASIDDDEIESSIQQARTWLLEDNVLVLNIAGPRESSCPNIGARSEQFLVALLQEPWKPPRLFPSQT